MLIWDDLSHHARPDEGQQQTDAIGENGQPSPAGSSLLVGSAQDDEPAHGRENQEHSKEMNNFEKSIRHE